MKSKLRTMTGLEVLMADELNKLVGARVGVLANSGSVTNDLIHIVDAVAASGIRITAMFGPEHGARGDAAAGESVDDFVDEKLGVKVYSLYGIRKAPTPESLENLDLMLVDVQDVGSRFYTFVYTVAEVMKACGKAGVPVWVLDRPNPIGGTNIEGPVLEAGFETFVGMYPIPIRHSLTLGELATLFLNEFGISCELRVICMRGWSREMSFNDTGLQWVMPSPNMPTPDTALVYPGMCLFEGTNVSEGRGTTRPFEIVGAPWINGTDLRAKLDDYNLPGVAFREMTFIPWDSKFRGERCGGIQVHVTDPASFCPVRTGIAALCAIHELYSDKLSFREKKGRFFFDSLAGNSEIRKQIGAGELYENITSVWTADECAFGEMAQHYLLY